MKKIILLIAVLMFNFAQADGKRAGVYFKNLADNQTLPSGTEIKFGVEGMIVKPAGLVEKGAGHHHLIINGGSIPKGEVITADATHVHFGKGQSEYKLDLAPGDYTLTLQFADGAHLSYGPAMSKTVKVKITPAAIAPQSH